MNEHRSGVALGYWRCPRWLAEELEDGNLTPTEFALAAYLGARGADRFGVSVTNEALASTLNVNARTVSRLLASLREKQIFKFELKQGQRRPFRVTAGPRLRDEQLPENSQSEGARYEEKYEVGYEVPYEVGYEVEPPVDEVGYEVELGRKPSPADGLPRVPNHAFDEVEVDVYETETETETENETNSKSLAEFSEDSKNSTDIHDEQTEDQLLGGCEEDWDVDWDASPVAATPEFQDFDKYLTDLRLRGEITTKRYYELLAQHGPSPFLPRSSRYSPLAARRRQTAVALTGGRLESGMDAGFEVGAGPSRAPASSGARR